MSLLGQKRTKHYERKSAVVRCYSNSGHVSNLSRYLPMILSEHDAIAGLDLKYAQMRWRTWAYSVLRAENFVCSFAHSASP
jgi:hypothetical protein